MLDFLNTQRVGSVMRDLRDVRELPGTLRWLNRIPVVPALDGEITAYLSNEVLIADVIPDDAAARTVSGPKIRIEIDELPNIKIGHKVTQERMILLNRLAAGALMAGEADDLTDWRFRTIDRLLLGVRQRMEQMVIGAILDSWTYNRHGIQATVTFGAPSDMKVTVGTAWSDSANATPVADIQTLQATAREKYGVNLDRITLTSVAFREMIATSEFQASAKLYSQLVNMDSTNFPLSDIRLSQTLAERTTGCTFEIYDEKHATEGNDGSITRANFVPDDKVILSSTALDNDPDVLDFANGVVAESLIGGGAGVLGTIPAASRGPIAYTTVTPDLNPPNATVWSVARGFPRRRNKAAFGVLTI